MVIFNPQLGDKRVHILADSISPKVNVIARLGFEHAYYDVATSALDTTSQGFPNNRYGRAGTIIL